MRLLIIVCLITFSAMVLCFDVYVCLSVCVCAAGCECSFFSWLACLVVCNCEVLCMYGLPVFGLYVYVCG